MSAIFLMFLIARPPGGEVSEDVEEAQDVRLGWHFAGLPLVNFNSDEGVGYGVRIAAYDHGDNEKPYRFAAIGQFFQTTNGVAYHNLQLDAPRINGSRWRVGGQLQLYAERFSNYFGIGNGARREPDLFTCDDRDALEENPNVCPGNPQFIGARYNNYSERVPAVLVNVRRDFTDDWQLFLGYRFRYYDLEVRYPDEDLGQDAPSKLVEDLRAGADLVGLELDEGLNPRGQRDGDIRAGIIYDSRDNEPAPTSGMWHSLLFRAAGPVAGGRYWYGGVTTNLRFYQQIAHRLVFATRLLGDFSFGDVPFYQLSLTPGLSDMDGIGGGSTLRGVVKNRFIGKIKTTATAELRYRFASFEILEQDIDLTLMAGFDAGRVWADYERDGPFFDFATGAVAGFYAAWNDNFIVRADYAQSFDQETSGLYITFNHYF